MSVHSSQPAVQARRGRGVDGTGTVLGAWAPGSTLPTRAPHLPPLEVTDVPPHAGLRERSGTRWFLGISDKAARGPGQPGGVLASCLFSQGPLWPHVPRRARQGRFPVPAWDAAPSPHQSWSRCQTAPGTRLLGEAGSPAPHWVPVSLTSDLPFMLVLYSRIFVSGFWCDRPRGDT